MNRLIYRLMYLLARPNWDTGLPPRQLIEAFTEGSIPPGPAIDLGCGTGTNAIYLAQQGREVMGIDFAPEAIARAQKKAQKAGVAGKARFLVADVTHLNGLGLPQCSFALDMGCFHGLDRREQDRYVQGLAVQMPASSVYLLYTLDPHRDTGITFGVAPEDVETLFLPHFQITRTERDEHQRSSSTWFWMKRRA